MQTNTNGNMPELPTLGEYQTKMLAWLIQNQPNAISGAYFKDVDPIKGNITFLEFVTSYRSIWAPEIFGELLMEEMYKMITAVENGQSMPVRFNDSHNPMHQIPLIGEWKDRTIPCIKGLKRINEESGGLSVYQVNHLLEYVEALEAACIFWRLSE